MSMEAIIIFGIILVAIVGLFWYFGVIAFGKTFTEFLTRREIRKARKEGVSCAKYDRFSLEKKLISFYVEIPLVLIAPIFAVLCVLRIYSAIVDLPESIIPMDIFLKIYFSTIFIFYTFFIIYHLIFLNKYKQIAKKNREEWCKYPISEKNLLYQ